MSDQDIGAEAIISDESELDTLREGVDDPQVLREQLRKEADARRQLTARAKKAEQEAREAKEALAKGSSTESTITKDNSSQAPMSKEELDLRLSGYDESETKFILQNGGKAALQDQNSLVSIAIKTKKEQRDAERAAAQTPDTSQLSEVERKFTPEQLANMSVKELEKILPHA